MARCAIAAHEAYNRDLAVEIVHQYARNSILGNSLLDTSTRSSFLAPSIDLAQEVVNHGARKGDVGLLRRLFDFGGFGKVRLNESKLAKGALKHAANKYTREYLASI